MERWLGAAPSSDAPGAGAAAGRRGACARRQKNELKLKTLEALRPSLGAQTTELYGRFALKPSTIFNHQARGNEPSISKQPLERAVTRPNAPPNP